jgi:hypothetical protein
MTLVEGWFPHHACNLSEQYVWYGEECRHQHGDGTSRVCVCVCVSDIREFWA